MEDGQRKRESKFPNWNWNHLVSWSKYQLLSSFLFLHLWIDGQCQPWPKIRFKSERRDLNRDRKRRWRMQIPFHWKRRENEKVNSLIFRRVCGWQEPGPQGGHDKVVQVQQQLSSSSSFSRMPVRSRTKAKRGREEGVRKNLLRMLRGCKVRQRVSVYGHTEQNQERQNQVRGLDQILSLTLSNFFSFFFPVSRSLSVLRLLRNWNELNFKSLILPHIHTFFPICTHTHICSN